GITAEAFPFVGIEGAEPANDALIINASGGGDTIDASELPANLIRMTFSGGAGNDTLTGTAGDDGFVWNPGDGTDTLQGQGGADTLFFNATNGPQTINLASSNGHLLLTSSAGGVNSDDLEQIALNTGHLSDVITIG